MALLVPSLVCLFLEKVQQSSINEICALLVFEVLYQLLYKTLGLWDFKLLLELFSHKYLHWTPDGTGVNM